MIFGWAGTYETQGTVFKVRYGYDGIKYQHKGAVKDANCTLSTQYCLKTEMKTR